MLGTAVAPGPAAPMRPLLHPNRSGPLRAAVSGESLQDYHRVQGKEEERGVVADQTF